MGNEISSPEKVEKEEESQNGKPAYMEFISSAGKTIGQATGVVCGSLNDTFEEPNDFGVGVGRSPGTRDSDMNFLNPEDDKSLQSNPMSTLFARALLNEVTDNPSTMTPAKMTEREKKLLKAQMRASSATKDGMRAIGGQGTMKAQFTNASKQIIPANLLPDHRASRMDFESGMGQSSGKHTVTIGLMLSSRHPAGHPSTVTRQTAFDFNKLQDREYKYVSSTDASGWRAGGGERGGPIVLSNDSLSNSNSDEHEFEGMGASPKASMAQKIPAPDMVHIPIIQIDCESEGAVNSVIAAIARGEVFIPHMSVMPEGLGVNGISPPDLVVRFGCERNDDFPPEEWPNWCLEFMHNQLYEYFSDMGARWMKRPFQITLAKKVRWKTVKHMNKFFAQSETVINQWREKGAQYLDPQLAHIEGGATPEEVARPHGIYLLRDGKPTNYFAPNFEPPYTTKMTRSLMTNVIAKSWDKKRRDWSTAPIPIVTPSLLLSTMCGCAEPNQGGFIAREATNHFSPIGGGGTFFGDARYDYDLTLNDNLNQDRHLMESMKLTHQDSGITRSVIGNVRDRSPSVSPQRGRSQSVSSRNRDVPLPHKTSSTASMSDSYGYDSQQSGYEQQQNAFDPQLNAYETSKNVYDQQQNGYESPQNTYEQQNNSYDPSQNAYGQQQNGYKSTQNSYEQQNNSYDPSQNAYGQQQNTYEQLQNAHEPPQKTYEHERNRNDDRSEQQQSEYEQDRSRNDNRSDDRGPRYDVNTSQSQSQPSNSSYHEESPSAQTKNPLEYSVSDTSNVEDDREGGDMITPSPDKAMPPVNFDTPLMSNRLGLKSDNLRIELPTEEEEFPIMSANPSRSPSKASLKENNHNAHNGRASSHGLTLEEEFLSASASVSPSEVTGNQSTGISVGESQTTVPIMNRSSSKFIEQERERRKEREQEREKERRKIDELELAIQEKLRMHEEKKNGKESRSGVEKAPQDNSNPTQNNKHDGPEHESRHRSKSSKEEKKKKREKKEKKKREKKERKSRERSRSAQRSRSSSRASMETDSSSQPQSLSHSQSLPNPNGYSEPRQHQVQQLQKSSSKKLDHPSMKENHENRPFQSDPVLVDNNNRHNQLYKQESVPIVDKVQQHQTQNDMQEMQDSSFLPINLSGNYNNASTNSTSRRQLLSQNSPLNAPEISSQASMDYSMDTASLMGDGSLLGGQFAGDSSVFTMGTTASDNKSLLSCVTRSTVHDMNGHGHGNGNSHHSQSSHNQQLQQQHQQKSKSNRNGNGNGNGKAKLLELSDDSDDISLSLMTSTSSGTGNNTDKIPSDEELFAIGWAKAMDPSSGCYYYFTLDRSQTVWENPLTSAEV